MSFFPDQIDSIGSVEREVEIFQLQGQTRRQAFTMDRGIDQAPLIGISFQNSPQDLLTLAHEFGHALQLCVSRSEFAAPAVREACAFLSELALLEHLHEVDKSLYFKVLQSWYVDNHHYLRRDGIDFRQVALSGTGRYDYRWNYPAGRLAAFSAFARLPRANLWSIFQNRLPLDYLVGLISLKDDTSLRPARWKASDARIPVETFRRMGLAVHEMLDGGAAATLGETFDRLMMESDGNASEGQAPHVRSLSELSSQCDYFLALGFILKLLAGSRYHHKFQVDSYFHDEILQPLRNGQCQLYISSRQEPSAFVSWAWLTPDVERDIHSTGRALRNQEWLGGAQLFFNDWISTKGSFRTVMWDMTENAFPDQVATSIQRNDDASVRRIMRWTGKSARKKNAKDSCPVNTSGQQDVTCA